MSKDKFYAVFIKAFNKSAERIEVQAKNFNGITDIENCDGALSIASGILMAASALMKEFARVSAEMQSEMEK